MQQIQIVGGEPSISQDFYDFLKRCIRANKTDFEIYISTNCVSVTKEFISLIKQFKNINPVNPPAWPKLKAVKIDEILNSKNYSCSPSIRVKIISSFIFLLFWTTFRKLKVFFK